MYKYCMYKYYYIVHTIYFYVCTNIIRTNISIFVHTIYIVCTNIITFVHTTNHCMYKFDGICTYNIYHHCLFKYIYLYVHILYVQMLLYLYIQ